MGIGSVVALALVVIVSSGLLLESRRVGHQIEGVAASVDRLRLLRRALDTLHEQAASIRRSTDLTADTVTHRGRR